MHRNGRRMVSCLLTGPCWGLSWTILGILGPPGSSLGLPWSPGVSWLHLGASLVSGDLRGASWGILGLPWSPGVSWGFLGLRGSPVCVLGFRGSPGASWGILWPSGPLGHPGVSWGFLAPEMLQIDLLDALGGLLGLPWSPGVKLYDVKMHKNALISNCTM